MSDLETFTREIEARLSAARHEPSWSPEERDRYMSTFAERRQEFERLAAHLISTIIEPRMAKLASYFPNSKCSFAADHGQCLCRFGYCERFPAGVTLQFVVEHDDEPAQVVIQREVRMEPRFLNYDTHEKLLLLPEEIDDGRVTIWIEQQLLKFLATYLQIDRGLADFDDEIVLDPVCGMRIRRAEAAAFDDHFGARVWFCSADCRQQFADDPQRFVGLRTSDD